MNINHHETRAKKRQAAYLNSQLSNGDHDISCHQCDKRFYPLYSSCFCSKKCAQDAFRALSEDCQVKSLNSRAALEMLAVCMDGVDIEDIRKIALLGVGKDFLFNC